MRTLRNLALLLVSLSIGFLLAEGLLRVYLAVAPTPGDSLYIPDPNAVYLLRPDPPEEYERDPDNYINSFGFRDREHPVQKSPGTYRIVGIGDSFVYGSVANLDEHFLKVAEVRVAERLGVAAGEVEMVLAGLGGYSPENYVGVLRTRGLSLKPDLVVLNFFVGNDVSSIPIRGKVCRGRLYYVGSPYPWQHILRKSWLFVLAEKAFLTRIRSALLRFWLKHIERSGRTLDKQSVPQAGTMDRHGARAQGDRRVDTIWTVHQQKKYLPVYRKEPNRRIRRLWREAEDYLRQFDTLCKQAGIPWVLYLIPAEIQVDPELRRRILGKLAVEPDCYDFDAPQRRLRTLAEAEGFTLLDPLPEFRARHQQEQSFYKHNDIHWNVTGNKIAGEILGDFIAARAGGDSRH